MNNFQIIVFRSVNERHFRGTKGDTGCLNDPNRRRRAYLGELVRNVIAIGLILAFSMIFPDVHFAEEAATAGVKNSVPNLWTRPVGHDWPRMLGPRSDGTSDERNPISDWSNGKLKIKWFEETGVGYGNCVVAKGRCFQWDRFGNQERLTCRNAETGSTLWSWSSPVQYEDSFGYNNGPRSSPVVDEDLVFVSGVDGTLAAIQVVDGKEVWKRATNEVYGVKQNFFGVGSTPCVFKNLLIFMIGGSSRDATSSALVAFDKLTGKEVYRVGRYLASYSAPIIAEFKKEPWCLAFVREGLLAFDPRNGEREVFFPWRARIFESVNAAWPVVSGDKIFISETYEIGAALLQFDGKSLTPVWLDQGSAKRQSWRAHWATPVLYKGHLFGCSGRNEPDADFRAIQLDNGKVDWTHRNHDRTSALLVDDKLIVIGEHGLLQMVAADTTSFQVTTEVDLGAEMKDFPIESLSKKDIAKKDVDPSQSLLESPVWAPPTLSHGLLYLRGKNRLVCLELIPQ